MSVLFSCIHGKWTWVRQWQIFREPLRGSRDLVRASPKFISPWTQKKDTHSLIDSLIFRTHATNQMSSQTGVTLEFVAIIVIWQHLKFVTKYVVFLCRIQYLLDNDPNKRGKSFNITFVRFQLFRAVIQ